MSWLELKWKQFWCVHHLHEVVKRSKVACGFSNLLTGWDIIYLCCKCGVESDAYTALGGL